MRGSVEVRRWVGRYRPIVLTSVLAGALTGGGVAALFWVTEQVVFSAVLAQGRLVWALAPGVGLAVAVLLLRHVARSVGAGTADEYVRAFHDPAHPLHTRDVLARLLASTATIGGGGALGLEGPSIYLGAAVGGGLQQRLARHVSRLDRQVLLVAGAAAGVAAIFKAPATGAVFALEVPYQDDLARRALLPALAGAASGYLAFVSVNGTAPLIPVAGAPDLGARQLLASLLVGVACGLVARGFAWLLRWAKGVPAAVPAAARVLVGGVVLGGAALLSAELFEGEPLSLGIGYEAIAWALAPERSVPLLLALLVIRTVVSPITLAAGGVGGLFVPLVVEGALVGRLLAELVDAEDRALLTVLGIAALLGAGYRVPLAAVMFVAETTGRPGFVVPGLLAAVAAQVTMGRRSVAVHQRSGRLGHLERRLELPLVQALTTDPATASPDDTVAEWFTEHVAMARRRAVPVVDDQRRYLGMVLLADVVGLERARWDELRVGEVARTDVPTGSPDGDLGAALAAMSEAGVDRLAVVDGAGRLLGVVSMEAIVDLDRLLDQLEGDDDRP